MYIIRSLITMMLCVLGFFFVKQKTAYEMRISDWSSDVFSSDLQPVGQLQVVGRHHLREAVEGVAVLVVRVQQHNMAEGMGAQDGVHHRGQRAGLARAGRAEDGEMLAQEIVGDQVGRPRAVLMQSADAHVGALYRKSTRLNSS